MKKHQTNNNITPILAVVIVLQWILFTGILVYQQQQQQQQQHQPQQSHSAGSIPQDRVAVEIATMKFRSSTDMMTKATTTAADTLAARVTTKYTGMAVTVFFRAPKWFHLRYTFMLQNAIMSLPDDTDTDKYAVQVFVNEHWLYQDVLPWHPALHDLLYHHPRVITQSIPEEFVQNHHSKPIQFFHSRWLWEHILADQVLLFSGNSVFCASGSLASKIWSQHLSTLDYCGTPWHHLYGRGGDASTVSYRNRLAMLRVISEWETGTTPQHNNRHNNKNKQDSTHTMPTSSSAVVETMHRMNEQKPEFRIATIEQTLIFGGVHNLSYTDTEYEEVLRVAQEQKQQRETNSVPNGESSQQQQPLAILPSRMRHVPYVVAGTQERISWSDRDSLLKHCPAYKVIFPSLHEPACFGAHPDGPTCKATICALQDVIPGSGC